MTPPCPTSCRFDQLVWFRPDANAGWWPAIYYESHLAAAPDLAKINHAIDETQQIALIYHYLQEQGGKCPPQPLVQLITGRGKHQQHPHPEKVATVTDPSTQLQRDFLQQLVQISQEPYASSNEEFRDALDEVRELVQTLRQTSASSVTSAVPPSTTQTIPNPNAHNAPRVSFQFTSTTTSSTTDHPSVTATVAPIPTSNHDNDIVTNQEDNTAEENDDNEEESISIEENDPWDMVLFKLQSGGWYSRTVDGSTEILYVKPGRGIAHPFQENVDFFRGPDRLKQYVATEFPRWKGDQSQSKAQKTRRRVTMSNAKAKKMQANNSIATPPHQTTKPQDPGIPLSLSSDGGASYISWSSIDTDVLGSFGATFDILKQRGWKAVRAKNPLQDWWYIRPGRSLAGGTPGVDYFTSEEDVIHYVQEQRRQEQIAKEQQPKKHSPEIDAIQHVAVQGGQSDVTKKRTLKKNGRESLPRKRILLPTNDDEHEQPPPAPALVTKNKKSSTTKTPKSKNHRTEHWWKYDKVPSFQNDIWPLLQRLGFDKYNDGYRLPIVNLVPGDPVVFPSATGLRKFLCAYGVPNYSSSLDDSKKSVLNAKEKERLRRWISFANVPVHSYNSIEKLNNIAAPKKEETILGWLYEFGCSTANNRIYVPEYTRMGPESRTKPTHGKHFYYDHELTTAIRKYVRDAWRLGIMYDDDQDGRVPVDDSYSGTLSKGASQKQEEKYLCLRVWAAVTTQELTTFQQMPPQEFVQPFLRMSEQECDDPPSPAESERESEVSSISSSSSGEESTENQRPVKVSAPAKIGAKKKNVNNIHYPCFTQEVWPVLQSFGFVVKNGRYHHPSIGFLADASAIQKFVICKGVPGIDPSKHKQEHEIVRLWAAFAYVDAVPSRIPSLLAQQLPADVVIHKILQKLGFHFFDGKIFPPDADSVNGARSKRVHKIHYYLNLDEIRVYIRSREFFSLLNDDTYFTKRPGSSSAVTAEEIVEIRNWAARSSAPLPHFIPLSVTSMHEAAESCELRGEKEFFYMNRGKDRFFTDDVSVQKTVNPELFEGECLQETPVNETGNNCFNTGDAKGLKADSTLCSVSKMEIDTTAETSSVENEALDAVPAAQSPAPKLEMSLGTLNNLVTMVNEESVSPLNAQASAESFRNKDEQFLHQASQTNDFTDPNKSPSSEHEQQDSAIESIEGNGSITKNIARNKMQIDHSSVFESLDKPSPANTSWKSTFDDLRMDDESTSSYVRTASEAHEEYEQLLLTQANIDDDNESVASMNNNFDALPTTQLEEDVGDGFGCPFF